MRLLAAGICAFSPLTAIYIHQRTAIFVCHKRLSFFTTNGHFLSPQRAIIFCRKHLSIFATNSYLYSPQTIFTTKGCLFSQQTIIYWPLVVVYTRCKFLLTCHKLLFMLTASCHVCSAQAVISFHNWRFYGMGA